MFENCGCYLGLNNLTPYAKTIEQNLIYDTSLDNTFRYQAIGLLEYKLADLKTNGLFPKNSYFNIETPYFFN